MQPEDIDKLFRDQLQHHAPAPPAYLWDQLEAEIKPARKRPTLWLYAAAAMIALLIVAGGAWLLRAPELNSGPATLASTVAPAAPSAGSRQPAAQAAKKSTATQATAATGLASSRLEDQQRPTDLAAATAPPAAATVTAKAGPRASLPKAATTAAAGARSVVVAQVAAKSAKASRPVPVPAQAVAVASSPAAARPDQTARAAVVQPEASSTPAATLTGPIEVEVHRGTETTMALAAADAPQSYHSDSHLKNLFHKAKTAVKDGRVKLPKVELPETVTVQVNVFNHTATKVIQL